MELRVMAPQLKALVAIAEDSGLVPEHHPYLVVHKHLKLQPRKI